MIRKGRESSTEGLVVRQVLLFASTNAGKLREWKLLLGPRWEVVPVPRPLAVLLPEEGSLSYWENARRKALWISRKLPGIWVLGEDAGLEVAGLGWGPGPRSARYGKAGNRCGFRLILEKSQNWGETDRRARFRACTALAQDARVVFSCESLVWGRILKEPRGDYGFGYDPIFAPEGEPRSFAEMTPQEKAQWSHRGKAARQLRSFLEGLPIRGFAAHARGLGISPAGQGRKSS
jgi:XTP/dITP diphosphohydrolase